MSVALTSNFLQNARGITFEDGGGITWSINQSTNQISANGSTAGAGAANPTAKVGLTVVDGSAGTFLRSDGAPPIDQSITPTWTELHTFSGGLTISAGAFTLNGYTLTLAANAVVSGTNTGDQTIPSAANPSGAVGLSAVNGSAATFMRSDGAPALSQAITPTWTKSHVFTPGSGAGITVNGVSASFAVLINGNSTTGNSLGLRIFAGTNSSDQALQIANQAATSNLFQVSGNGAIFMPSISTTASAANAFIDSSNSNNILRSTSSIRYKMDVVALSDEVARSVLSLHPVKYRSTAAADDKELFWYGLIAEDVAKVAPRLVHYDKHGRPDGVQYDRVGVLLLAFVKQMHAQLVARGVLEVGEGNVQ